MRCRGTDHLNGGLWLAGEGNGLTEADTGGGGGGGGGESRVSGHPLGTVD